MSTPEQAWSIAELARTLKGRVEDGFAPVWVRGELVGVKRYPSGHWYFGLRDPVAKVDCTMWKGAALRLRQPLEEGTEVFALGTPSFRADLNGVACTPDEDQLNGTVRDW